MSEVSFSTSSALGCSSFVDSSVLDCASLPTSSALGCSSFVDSSVLGVFSNSVD